MEENEKFDSDFSNDKIPISEEFWNYMENYWHNNREFPESTEASLSKKADLVDGKVPASQLPSYVDDVLEFDSFENLPNPGEKGKIYLITNDNSQFRWSGLEYIQLNSDEFVMTTNTQQGVYGTKEFYTSGGSNNYTSTTLRIAGFTGNNAIIGFNSFGAGVGTVQFDGGDYFFTNDDISGRAKLIGGGFIKDGYSDNSVLLAGGGHKLLSDLETTHTHSYLLNDNYYQYQDVNNYLEAGKMKFIPSVMSASPNIFPTTNNANGILSIGIWSDTLYGHEIGFSSNGDIYHRYKDYGNISSWGKLLTDLNTDTTQFVTTNTQQSISVNKRFLTQGGNGYLNNSLSVYSNDGSYPAMTFERSGDTPAQMLFQNDTFYFLNGANGDRFKIESSGFIKAGYNNEFILLAGGDVKLISDFVANKIINGSYNANNLSTNSITYGYSVANAPTSASSHSFTILNLDTADQNFKMQIGFDGDTNEMFSRTKSAGNWNDWVKYATTSQLSNYVAKSGDTMTGGLIVNSPDSIGSNNLGVLPQNTKLFLANGNTLVANYGTVFWTEGTGNGYIQQQRADGTAIAYRLNLQPYGGQLFYGNNEVATVNQLNDYHKLRDFLLSGDTNDVSSNTSGNLYYNQLANSPYPSSQDIIGSMSNFGGKSFGYDFATVRLGGSRLYFRDYYGTNSPSAWNEIYHTGNFNPNNYATVNQLNNYIPNSHPVYGITQNEINEWRGYLGYWDNRQIQPSHILPEKLQFGFTSWNSDVNYPYADFIHFGGYNDSSGGNQNLIVFKKNGFGIRQFQGKHQDATPYQSFVDFWNTGDFTQSDINNWNNNRFNKAPINLITSSFDANTINESGFYRIGYGTSNTGGYSSSNDGLRALLHFETEDVYSASQIQTERYTGNTISRTRTDGVWSNWIRHWGNNDFSQNDINNWNNIANTATTQSWIESQDYANHAFVEESLNQLTVEHINPDYPISTISKVNTIIITEEFGREYLELEREFISERQITVTNLSPHDIGVMIEDKIIDRVISGETTEYYITSEKRLVKKGSYRNASLLV
ncbi:hypothetical protein AR438_03145 [Chryseobacterium aquaticum]|uniref:Uncharacterized protein n=1 Tax=Chryseobacterium aquaticum TaxID=452084 RepID=A0A0Q3LV40_9FLAO|nr:pyocin knob domain-containing protein [Chryseobacterium aquaticum]KQK27217.1 hypothetical protein AR438_03145 [Chryseobacterium aquaticum]